MGHVLLLLLVACAGPEGTQPSQTAPAEVVLTPAPEVPSDVAVAYTLDLTAAHTHLVEVEAVVETAGADAITWMMPVWTPGSYLVREFARNVERVAARGASGEPLPVRKMAKNRWQVDTAGHERIALTYVVYAKELSVRTSHVDVDAAILNGASTFLVPVEARDRPLGVTLRLPAGWSRSETSLDPHPDGVAHHYVARDLDHLVDAPILAGTPHVAEFTVADVPHRLVEIGGAGLWDHDRAAADVQRLTEEIVAFWGFVPYDRYLFLNVLDQGRGGLEHMDGALMIAPRTAAAEEGAWDDWLGLVSHELFHAWNIKRLRPVGLGPFDYEREVHTESLWVAEGLTSYYDDLLLVRAGLLEPEAHLQRLSDSIAGLQRRPGRHVQPLSQASFDAWTEQYRPDEHSVDSAVSYYRKGSLVGWLLDVEIRRLSQGRASLDDALRLLYERTQEGGYTPEDVVAVTSEVAGADLSPRFAAWVEGTDELDYGLALRWLGLRFADPGEVTPSAWLGARLAGAIVREVPRDTPAWRAGLNVGDEILGLDHHRFEAGTWDDVLRRYAEGASAELLVARRGRLVRLTLPIEQEPVVSWTLELDPEADAATTARRERWWGQR